MLLKTVNRDFNLENVFLMLTFRVIVFFCNILISLLFAWRRLLLAVAPCCSYCHFQDYSSSASLFRLTAFLAARSFFIC